MSDYLSHTCCLPESGGLKRGLNAEDALNLEARGILCASAADPAGLATVHAQCPGPLYYPTYDEMNGKCKCSLWDKPLPLAGMEGMGSPTENECLLKCRDGHMHHKVTPHMPVDMIGGKCMPASSDLADYPSYLGGLETCCLVGDFVEGYDADVWGPGSLCNKLFPQEKVWLQVPWDQGVQRLCKKVPKREVQERYPGIQECKTAYDGLTQEKIVAGVPIPYCYVTEQDLPHGPHIRQCWSGIQGIGEQSPQCGGGAECGYMPSCVAYPPGSPTWDSTGGPTGKTCQIAQKGKNCEVGTTMEKEYWKNNQKVGYFCDADTGNVACCTVPLNSNVKGLSPDTASLTCPSARLLSQCPACPPPGTNNKCNAAPAPHTIHCGEPYGPAGNPQCSSPLCTFVAGSGCVPATGIPQGGACVPNETTCAPHLSCVMPATGGGHGTCQPHA